MDRLAFSVLAKNQRGFFLIFFTCRLKEGISSMPQELHQNLSLSSHHTNESGFKTQAGFKTQRENSVILSKYSSGSLTI